MTIAGAHTHDTVAEYVCVCEVGHRHKLLKCEFVSLFHVIVVVVICFIDALKRCFVQLLASLNGTQGDEIGMPDNNDFPVNDHRDVARTPMQWDSSIAAGKLNRKFMCSWRGHPSHAYRHHHHHRRRRCAHTHVMGNDDDDDDDE